MKIYSITNMMVLILSSECFFHIILVKV
jgi:hypothetical protein